MTTPIIKKYIQSYLSNSSYEGNILIGKNQLDEIGVTSIYDICCDYNGNLYATDQEQHVVLKISSKGSVRILAGVLGVRGCDGNVVKAGNISHFNTPKGIVCDRNGYIYVADSGNNQIKRISPNGVVNVFCGGSKGQDGYSNTYPFLLNSPTDVEIDCGRHLYVADFGNNCVRCFRIGSRSAITIAGNGDEAAGDTNGVATEARLNGPISLAIDNNEMLYVADSGNYKIKRINNSHKVNTFSGDGIRGDLIGTSTRFLDLYGIKSNGYGSLLAWDYSEDRNGRLLRFNENGKSFLVRRFANIDAVCLDRAGNIYSVENGYVTTVYSSSSSSSYSSSLSSSSSSYSTSNSSNSTNSSDSTSSTNSSSTSSTNSSSSGPATFRYFNNAANDNDWNTLSNWWLDEEFTIPSDSLPMNDDVVHAYQPITTSPVTFVHLYELEVHNNDPHIHTYDVDNFSADILNVEKSYFNGEPIFVNANVTLNSTLYSEVFGIHNFYDTSNCAGRPKWGVTNFYDNSQVQFGDTKGHVLFYDNTYNSQNGALRPTAIGDPFNVSLVYGSAKFYNNSYNRGIILVETTFYDNSYMLGGTATTSLVTFNNNSSMKSGATINGNVVFNDNSYMESGATINGNVTVNYPAQNPLLGTVNGTITYVGY